MGSGRRLRKLPGLDTVYVDPDTIRREGHLMTVWDSLDYKTVQTKKGISHLSITAI